MYGYIEGAKSKCKYVYISDVKVFQTLSNGSKVVDASKLDNLCSNNCSNNGICRDGICVCNSDFTNYDCSLNLKDLPLLYTSTYTNNTFDLANQTLTDIFLVVSKFLPDSYTASIKCTLTIVTLVFWNYLFKIELSYYF